MSISPDDAYLRQQKTRPPSRASEAMLYHAVTVDKKRAANIARLQEQAVHDLQYYVSPYPAPTPTYSFEAVPPSRTRTFSFEAVPPTPVKNVFAEADERSRSRQATAATKSQSRSRSRSRSRSKSRHRSGVPRRNHRTSGSGF